MTRDEQLFQYLLRLGDSPLILAQRLGEWVGHGPILEEDIAQTNVGLDLLGQARLWLSYAGEVESRFEAAGRDEDQLAFLRDAGDFRNLLLVEQPNGNFADTTARQFLFDAWHLLLLRALAGSSDPRIAGIAAKGAKEAAYHVERSGDWVIRLGDGTDESHAKMQAAIDELWMYTGEMFAPDAIDEALIDAGIAADVRSLAAPWRQQVDAMLRRGDVAERRMASSCSRAASGAYTPSISGISSPKCRSAARASGSALVIAAPRCRSSMRPTVRWRCRWRDRARRSVGALWDVLATVPDPEIPAVSVVELGILRGIEWDATDAATLVVTVTPTYSGCPATEVIMASIEDALTAAGVARVRIETRLVPAWTTDWMTPEAKRKLTAYGIAPPDGMSAPGRPKRELLPLGGMARAREQQWAQCRRPPDRRGRHQPAAPRVPWPAPLRVASARNSCRSSGRRPARRITAASPVSSRSTISSRIRTRLHRPQ